MSTPKVSCDGNLLGFDLPISEKPLKVLDSGCADGTWLLSLASEYPQKQFSLHGIDIGSSLFLANPHLDLRQHDLLQQFPQSWHWNDNFDIIHQRFLVWGLKQNEWPRVVRNLGTVLKPGGRIQLVECKWIFPELWETRPEQHKLALTQIWSTQMAGMDIHIGEKLVDLLQELGFEDVKTVSYDFAYGATAKREEDPQSVGSTMGGEFPASKLVVWVVRDSPESHVSANSNLVQDEGIPGVAKTPDEYHAFLDRLVEEMKAVGYTPELRMVSGRKPQ